MVVGEVGGEGSPALAVKWEAGCKQSVVITMGTKCRASWGYRRHKKTERGRGCEEGGMEATQTQRRNRPFLKGSGKSRNSIVVEITVEPGNWFRRRSGPPQS